MALVGFDKDEIIDYVPECDGNRDSDDPCVVRLKFVPYSKVSMYARMIEAQTKGKMNKYAEVTQTIQKKQFMNSVESISGYVVSKKEVTTPEEFYETADTELVLEIVKAMESQSKLDEGQRKNFQSASDSSSSVLAAAPSTVRPVPTETLKTGIAATDFSFPEKAKQ